MADRPTAVRIAVCDGEASDAVVARARELGVLGWVRADGDRVLRLHAEGAPDAVAALCASLGGAEVQRAKVEGHEQFAVRGVDAGAFVVRRHAGRRSFELSLQVDGAMRCWAVPKGPSMDPSDKRLAVESATGDDAVEAVVWDSGSYEQGGRVAWPEALDRGHAVFVLHGERLRGGFALQRTGSGAAPRWLLVKRRDDAARPGSDVVAEHPDGNA